MTLRIAVVGAGPAGIYATDASGSCVFVNDKWQELSGLTREEALGTGWRQAIHPEDVGYVDKAWSAFAHGGAPFAVEFRFLRRDGSIAWVASRAVQFGLPMAIISLLTVVLSVAAMLLNSVLLAVPSLLLISTSYAATSTAA